MNSWIRLYRDAATNPKVQRLSDRCFRFWVNCLCLSDDQGMLPDIDDLSWSQRIQKRQAEPLLTELVDSGLIDCLENGYRMHNWATRQFHTDVSTQRVKRFRQRHMKRQETVSRNAPEQSRTETEAETLRSEQSSSAVAAVATAAEALRIDRPKRSLAAAADAALAAPKTELTDPTLAACALALDLVPREHPQRRQCELVLMEARDRIAKADAPRKYAERIIQDLLRRA